MLMNTSKINNKSINKKKIVLSIIISFFFLLSLAFFIDSIIYKANEKTNTIEYISQGIDKTIPKIINSQKKYNSLATSILTGNKFSSGQQAKFNLKTTENYFNHSLFPVYDLSVDITTEKENDTSKNVVKISNNDNLLLNINCDINDNNIILNLPQISSKTLDYKIEQNLITSNIDDETQMYYELLNYSPLFFIIKNAAPDPEEFLLNFNIYINYFLSVLPDDGFKIEGNRFNTRHTISLTEGEIIQAILDTFVEYKNDSYFKKITMDAFNIDDEEDYYNLIDSLIIEFNDSTLSNTNYYSLSFNTLFYDNYIKSISLSAINSESSNKYTLECKSTNKIRLSSQETIFDSENLEHESTENIIDIVFKKRKNSNSYTGIIDCNQDNNNYRLYCDELILNENEFKISGSFVINGNRNILFSCEAQDTGDALVEMILCEADDTPLIFFDYSLSPFSGQIEREAYNNITSDSEAYWSEIDNSEYIDYLKKELHYDSLVFWMESIIEDIQS